MPKKENTHKIITIINPDAWGVKFNKTAQYYFQFRTDFFGNPQVATLSNGAKLLLLSIFSESSRRSKGTLSYCLEYACGLLNYPLDDIKGFLMELEHNEIIRLETGVKRSKHNITEQNRTEQASEKQMVDDASCKIDLVFDDWNKMCEVLKNDHDVKLPKVNSRTKERIELVKKMLTHLPEQEDWKKAMSMVAANKFNRGENDRGWVANFDWFVGKTKQPYVKLNEEWYLANED
jgi:hypothetical protein